MRGALPAPDDTNYNVTRVWHAKTFAVFKLNRISDMYGLVQKDSMKSITFFLGGGGTKGPWLYRTG